MSGLESLHREFAEEMEDLANEVLELLGDWRALPDDVEPLRQILRDLHTIKGSAGLLELKLLSELCHNVEELLLPYRSGDMGPPPEALLSDTREALEAIRAWLGSMKVDGADPPNVTALMGRLRAAASPNKPQVTRLIPRQPHKAPHSTNAMDSLSSMDIPPLTVGTPDAAADQDMVNTLLELLTREDHKELGRLSRPQGKPAKSPLGFGPQARERPDGPPSPQEPPRSGGAQPPPPRRTTLRTPPALVDDRPQHSIPPEEQPEGDRSPDPIAEALSLTPVQSMEMGLDHPAQAPPEQWSRVAMGAWPSPQADLPRIGERTGNSLRVEVSRLDALLDLLGDLLQEKHRQARLVEALEDSGPEHLAREAAQAHRRLSLRLAELRDAVVRTRMTPIHSVFRRYPRLVEDMARSLGREVELQIQGEDAELDRALMESLFEPLVHLLRNAVDHGIEPPTERLRRGKGRRGQMILSASREGSTMVIELRDDGRGIDVGRMAARAISQGLIREDALQEMNPQERLELIFIPGMTSATQVTETSGRGMGMDSVRATLKRIGGRIELSTQVGEGTTVRLIVPLTLAIIQVLLVRVGDLRFGLPVSSILDVSRGNMETLFPARGCWLLRHKEGLIKTWGLGQLIGLKGRTEPPKRFHVAVLGAAEHRFGIWADQFEGIFECVIKPLSLKATTIPGVLGGTSTGTGDTTLVLDPAALADAAFNAQ